ncbi:MAG: polyphenol oxidase family protein [Candidatus Omnitrophota bacterium]
MRLTEREHCFLIEDFFENGIIAGFTKKTLLGNIPEDIHAVLYKIMDDYSVAYLNQPHSAVIQTIDKKGLYEGDGLFTDAKNLVLAVRTADCLPVFIADAAKSSIGIVHMGWLSAKKGILDNLPADLANCKVACGVGLRKCCYAVGIEFLGFGELSSFLEGQRRNFDVIAFTKEKVSSKGLHRENFLDINICSLCSGNFSNRRNGTTNRTLSFIVNYAGYC